MAIPGYGNWSRKIKFDGCVIYKTGETTTEDPPVLSHYLLSDLRILEHLIGIQQLALHTGYSVSTISRLIHNDDSLGGILPIDRYNKIKELRKNIFSQYPDKTQLERMRLQFTTHKLFRCKSLRIRENFQSVSYQPPQNSIQTINSIRSFSSNSIENRPHGLVRQNLTESIQNRLIVKFNNINRNLNLLSQKTGYSSRNLRKILNPSFRGRSLDPVKGEKLLQYISNEEDLVISS